MYLILETAIKEIERVINSFWWGGGSTNGGIKWLAWDRMAYPKAYGGLEFRNLHLFNTAMVSKQGWHFITKPKTLVAKVYKVRYFPNSFFFLHPNLVTIQVMLGVAFGTRVVYL
jgi:hypothetical protein